jgi:eukaryotic-like serine/threonine-protein kinase
MYDASRMSAHVAGSTRKLHASDAREQDSDDGLRLLRERIRLFAASFTLLSVTASLACPAVGVLVLDSTWGEQFSHPGNLAGLVAPLPLAGIWGLCQFTNPSRRLLLALDFIGTFSFCLGWAVMSGFAPSAAHPALDVGAALAGNPPIGVFANMAVLYLRAAVIPGTPRRTLIVSLVSSAPVVGLTWWIRAAVGTPAAASFAVGTTLLTLWIVPGPAIVTWVVYSLRRQIREARQLGQYTLEAKIGEGGMGVVYRARHALLRRQTAIKLLPPDRANANDIARFEREVQETSRLTHSNTVAIYDYGRTSDGVFYYAMEYLDGLSLEELVHHDGPQHPGRVVHILRQACGALGEAHDRGLIHRDIKPANLHLCVRGGAADHVKVLDFGLVKDIGGEDDTRSANPSGPNPLSTQGSFLGTPLYMAPEAVARTSDVDARTDLYALGAVGYFLLTGTPVFRARTIVEVCAMHLHHPPETPSLRLGSDLPVDLEALVLGCLAKSPKDRPQTASDLALSLAGCRGVPAWTEAEARTWWTQRAPELLRRAQSERSGAATPSANTVAVDLDRRAHPA